MHTHAHVAARWRGVPVHLLIARTILRPASYLLRSTSQRLAVAAIRMRRTSPQASISTLATGSRRAEMAASKRLSTRARRNARSTSGWTTRCLTCSMEGWIRRRRCRRLRLRGQKASCRAVSCIGTARLQVLPALPAPQPVPCPWMGDHAGAGGRCSMVRCTPLWLIHDHVCSACHHTHMQHRRVELYTRVHDAYVSYMILRTTACTAPKPLDGRFYRGGFCVRSTVRA